MLNRFKSVARQRPYMLRDLPNGITEVLLGPKTRTLGCFNTTDKELLSPGFVLAPHPQLGEAEELVAKPSLFMENRESFQRLAEIFKQNIHLDSVYQDMVAGETKTRFFHIHDFRQPPLFGRIPEVEDIIGTVELDIGKRETTIVPNSFSSNSMYRPLTRHGATLVSDRMFDLFKQALERP